MSTIIKGRIGRLKTRHVDIKVEYGSQRYTNGPILVTDTVKQSLLRLQQTLYRLVRRKSLSKQSHRPSTMSTPAPAGFTDPNFPNPGGPHDARIIIYGYVFGPNPLIDYTKLLCHSYTPNFALAILAIVLFAISLFLHTFELLRYRTWYFSPLAFACIMEVVGYVFRSLSSRQDPYSVINFVVQYFFIVVAPVFISASIYVCLSKLIGWAAMEGFDTRSRAWLRPKLILWGFVACDVVATMLQIAGAGLIGSAESNQKSSKVPNDILLAGLVFQTFAFTIFLSLFAMFVISLHSDQSFRPHVARKRLFFLALAAASLLVYLRTIFRLAETAQGVFGFLSTHEAFFGALEFAPVVVAVWVLGIWHPGRWIAK